MGKGLVGGCSHLRTRPCGALLCRACYSLLEAIGWEEGEESSLNSLLLFAEVEKWLGIACGVLLCTFTEKGLSVQFVKAEI